MKKLLAIAFTLVLACSLSLAQDTGGDKAAKTGKTPATATKTNSKSKSKKPGKKGGKKSTGNTATPLPK